jgi:hypothetical protein
LLIDQETKKRPGPTRAVEPMKKTKQYIVVGLLLICSATFVGMKESSSI